MIQRYILKDLEHILRNQINLCHFTYKLLLSLHLKIKIRVENQFRSVQKYDRLEILSIGSELIVYRDR